MALTVGQLKRALYNLDDDFEVVVANKDGWADWIATDVGLGYTDGSNHTVPMSEDDLTETITRWIAEDDDVSEEEYRRQYRFKVFTLHTI